MSAGRVGDFALPDVETIMHSGFDKNRAVWQCEAMISRAHRFMKLYPCDKRPQRPPSRLLIGHSPFPEESC